jgi:hypothetical protein
MTSQYGIGALKHKSPKKVSEGVKQDLDRAGKAIKRAYKSIDKRFTNLAKYLKSNINTGTQYRFTDTSMSWDISM